MNRVRLGKILIPAAKVVLWILVFAAVGLPAVFMNSIYGYLPVLCLFIALVVSVGSLFYLRSKLSADADVRDVSCQRGSSVDIGLKLENNSWLFCPKATAVLFISDLFGASDSVQKISFTISSHETVDFSFGMDMSHIGMYSVGLDQVEIYDFFGVIKLSVPVTGKFNAFVTPRIRALDEFHAADDVLAEAATDTRITVVGGSDYTGVREYALGDPMKQIHWKLSAHTREYVTKLQESSRQQEFSIVLDFAALGGCDSETLMDINDCLIETSLSVIEDVAHHDAAYTLLFTNRDRQVETAVPVGRDSDIDLIRSFSVISPEPDADFPDAVQIMEQAGSMQKRSTNVVVVTSRVNSDLVQALQRVKRQKRAPELYYIIPAAWTSRDIENAAARLKPLDQMEIPYYFVPTSEKEAE